MAGMTFHKLDKLLSLIEKVKWCGDSLDKGFAGSFPVVAVLCPRQTLEQGRHPNASTSKRSEKP